MAFTQYSQFDVRLLQFSKPMKNKQDAQAVWVNYNGGKGLVQTPKVKFPFGISSWPKDPNQKSLSIPVSNQTFLATAEAIDNAVVDHVYNNSELLIGKNKRGERYTREQVEDIYQPILKRSKKDPEKYDPVLRAKITPQVKIADANKVPQDEDYIKRGSVGVCIIQLGSLYFMSNSFGMPIYAYNVQVLEQAAPVQADFDFHPIEEGEASANVESDSEEY